MTKIHAHTQLPSFFFEFKEYGQVIRDLEKKFDSLPFYEQVDLVDGIIALEDDMYWCSRADMMDIEDQVRDDRERIAKRVQALKKRFLAST